MAPIIPFFKRITSYFEDAEDKPLISTSTAAGLSVAYTLFYVLPLYFSAATRPSPSLSRDAPSVIQARIRAVTVSCIVAASATLYVILNCSKYTFVDALHLLGWWPIDVGAVARSLLLTAILFTGPLFEGGIVEGAWKDWVTCRKVPETLGSWMGWRNFVAGPISEELVFRSTLIPLHLLAKISSIHIVFFLPLYFGIAHVHHFYEFKLTHPHTPILPAIARSVIQFSYTTIFGWYATFIYIRTGSLLAVVLAHSFCNWCGLPRFWGKVKRSVPTGPPRVRSKEDADYSSMLEREDLSLSIWWTVAYYILLFAGAYGFHHYFWILTESSGALVQFS